MQEITDKISDAVIRRLPGYYRYLGILEADGEDRVSSSRMSEDLGLNASQIRRDLNCFGGFGQQGYGYSVGKLKIEIERILGLDRKYSVVIVGAGNMGQALVKYYLSGKKAFIIDKLFDTNPDLVGTEVAGVPVMHLDELSKYSADNPIDIGVICTPKEVAQVVADALSKANVKGVWNFAPANVTVSANIAVENIHLNDTFRVTHEKLVTRTNRVNKLFVNSL